MLNSIDKLVSQAKQLLDSSSDTPQLDAEVLLSFCLNKSRSYLKTWPERPLSEQQQRQFLALISQRQTGIPVAYLTGYREFWSREFKVSPDVLIPRADSETLIELALNHLSKDKSYNILDLGTGSGILAITLAAERPKTQVIASDICPKALRIAQHNAQQHHINNIQFIHSNWLNAITPQQFELIISNPPYIAEHDPHLQQGDVRYEPRLALTSPQQGLQAILQITDQARYYLTTYGLLLIEHGYNQQSAVQKIFKQLNYQAITTHFDLSGQPRVTSGLWKPL